MKIKIGIIARTFAMNKKDVQTRIKYVLKLLEKIAKIKGVDFITKIYVWADENYKSDCGETFNALQKVFKEKNLENVAELINFTDGELFVDLPNKAIKDLDKENIDWVFLISPDAHEYLTQNNVDAMLKAIEDGALVTGPAMRERKDILEGCIVNTIGIWNIKSLLEVGGFNKNAALAKNSEKPNPNAGVEEVITLAKLVEKFGQCIAPILPKDKLQHYEEPDKDKQPEVWKRNKDKFDTIISRQKAHLKSADYSFDDIKKGVMTNYRHSPAF